MDASRTRQWRHPRNLRGTTAVFGSLPLLILLLRERLAPWLFMWLLAFAIFQWCKWITWSRSRGGSAGPWRVAAYFLAWPGLDAEAFFGNHRHVASPRAGQWWMAWFKTLLGATLLWLITPRIPGIHTALKGWCGMVGLILTLHFGVFHLLALLWQRAGVQAKPLMANPLAARSLGEFWGIRWNSAFNQLVFELIFRPLQRKIGTHWAALLVFFASGLVHELVISVPARGGYGWPTGFFLLQGAGLLFERTWVGRSLGLRNGLAGWTYTVLFTAGPAYWLFHPPFVNQVILPFLKVIHAG